MPDKKLTDSEIVKGFKDELHLAEIVDSDFCNGVKVSLIKSALDLINRLQGENKNLKAEVEKQKKKVEMRNKFIADLKEKDKTRHKVFETKCEELENAEAENKRLSTLAELGNKRANDYRVMRDRALKAEAENERLKDFATSKCADCAGCTSWKCDCANIEAEAYKEFAEKLYEELRMYGIKDKFNKVVFLNLVDKAKKELEEKQYVKYTVG